VTTENRCDKLVDAALWLMMNGDRGGAERLVMKALRIEPDNLKAKQVLKKITMATVTGDPAPPPQAPEVEAPLEVSATVVAPSKSDVAPAPQRTRPATGKVRSLEVVNPRDSAIDTQPRDLHATWDEEDSQATMAMSPQSVSSSSSVSGSFGSPNFVLNVVSGPGLGKSLAVSKSGTVLGRGLAPVSSDRFVSPAHASFHIREGALWVVDAGSTSGVYVSINGEHILNDGALFAAGQQLFRYLGSVKRVRESQQPLVFGAPVEPGSWRIEHMLTGMRGGRIFVFSGKVSIGRDAGTLCIPSDPSLAPMHCMLRLNGDDLVLSDRTTDRGTLVRLARRAMHKLSVGAVVQVGATRLRVTVAE
jgi:pSer/pThr/pTyr-binding forkhead associated (FHA) protein